MTGSAGEGAVRLRAGAITATVLPDEGGVLVDLLVDGRPVLVRTPWADATPVAAPPAALERDWVERWRGGWQLCFPTAGAADPAARPVQSFHGTASQAPWAVVGASDDAVELRWADADGLAVHRTWRVVGQGVRVETRVLGGAGVRELLPAEHLILGGHVLGGPVSLHVDSAAVRPLDAEGAPTADWPVPWPGDPGDRWDAVDETTPARMGAVIDVEPRGIRVAGAHVRAEIAWTGDALPHLLLWEELGVSTEPPWNAQIRALGIEPTSAPHGAGTAVGTGVLGLEPGDELSWSVELTVEWTDPEERA